MADLKDSWKETGIGLGHAFRDLGKTLIKTATEGAKLANEWANSDDKPQDEQQKPETEENK